MSDFNVYISDESFAKGQIFADCKFNFTGDIKVIPEYDGMNTFGHVEITQLNFEQLFYGVIENCPEQVLRGMIEAIRREMDKKGIERKLVHDPCPHCGTTELLCGHNGHNECSTLTECENCGDKFKRDDDEGYVDIDGVYCPKCVKESEEEEDELCHDCNGSGEGYVDGSKCMTCRGKGVLVRVEE